MHLDTRWKGLLNHMARARDAVDRAEYEDARQGFLEVRAQCLRQGIKSAHLAWSLAVTCDGLGDLETALEYIEEATALDPLSLPYQRSRELILEHIRTRLSDEARAPDDQSTPTLYALLVRANAADTSSHLAMARHLAHAGDHPAALRLLEALTTLAPHACAAWTLTEQIACALGDREKAAEARFESRALAQFASLKRTQGGDARG